MGWRVRQLVSTIPVAGALVLSFNGLAALARACRIDGLLAYLWPVTLDATGVVASLIWMDEHAPARARRAARSLALAAIVLSVSGNGLWHWLLDTGQRPHVLVQIAVGSVPPLVLFAMLHVLQLARADAPPEPAATTPAPDLAGERAGVATSGWTGLVVTVRYPPAPVEPAGVLDLPPLPPATSHQQVTSPPPVVGVLAGGHQVSPGTHQTEPVERLALPAGGGHQAPAARHLARPPAGHPTTRPGEHQRVATTWHAHIDAAARVVATNPAIGRTALATRLSLPTNQARQLLAHLRDHPELVTTAAAPAGPGAVEPTKELT